MPVMITMPALSPTMEKGNLVKWCKSEGDEISVGDVICEIDTDKATMEVESLHKGIIAKIIVPEGSFDIAVKTPIAILRQKKDSDDDVNNMINSLSSNDAHKPIEDEKKDIVMRTDDDNNNSVLDNKDDVSNGHIETQNNGDNNDRIKASPLAKKIANEYGINLRNLKGSGPMGRIVKNDVLRFHNNNINDSASSSSSKHEYDNKNSSFGRNDVPYFDEDVPNMRKVIAEKLTRVKNEVPHFYMTISCDVDDMMNIVKSYNASLEDISRKISLNDVIIKIVALGLKKYPSLNSSWIDGKIRHYNNIDVSFAVAVDGGIFTPIIKNADMKSLRMISDDVKNLVQKARSNSLKPEEFLGGSITTSNLGMTEVEEFYSIINPPQGSILSIGRATKQPVVKNDEIKISRILKLGYAVDHRVIDGKDAGLFLSYIKQLLENPTYLMFS